MVIAFVTVGHNPNVIDTTHGTLTDDELVWSLVRKTASAENGDEGWQHLLRATLLLNELVWLSNSTVQRGVF